VLRGVLTKTSMNFRSLARQSPLIPILSIQSGYISEQILVIPERVAISNVPRAADILHPILG
jgi:hypothetical protein